MTDLCIFVPAFSVLCMGIMGAMKQMKRQDFKEFQKYPYLIDY